MLQKRFEVRAQKFEAINYSCENTRGVTKSSQAILIDLSFSGMGLYVTESLHDCDVMTVMDNRNPEIENKYKVQYCTRIKKNLFRAGISKN